MPDPKEAQVYATLRRFGAPLANRAGDSPLGIEVALARAMALAHHDATLLRVLPLVVARNAGHLDQPLLVSLARADGVRTELGMVVELASRLAPSPELSRLAEALGPPSGTPPTPFFLGGGKYARQLADAHGLPLARRWGFLLNQGEDSFRDIFTKHLG